MKLLVMLPLLCAACSPSAAQPSPEYGSAMLPPPPPPYIQYHKKAAPTKAEMLSSINKMLDALHELRQTIDAQPMPETSRKTNP